jgi:hypothetical protein
MINDMCRNENQTSGCSHFSIMFDQLLLRKHHGKESVVLPLCLPLGQLSHYTIHVIKHVSVYSYDVTQGNGMPFRHSQGPIPGWSLNSHDILDNWPLILCGEEWPVFAVLYVFKQLEYQFT